MLPIRFLQYFYVEYGLIEGNKYILRYYGKIEKTNAQAIVEKSA